MLDERTGTLLAGLNECCGEGSYQIVEERELLGLFPRSKGVDVQDIRAMLEYLKDERFVEVRYAEEGVYCVRPLPEGRRYFEEVRRERRESRERKRNALLLSLVGALVGGFSGSLLAWAVSLLL